MARLERLPVTSWHVRARVIVGTATFFDAFDVLTIALALPVLVQQWQLSPTGIGFLISSGFVGQIGGALLFGWVAERFGRVRAMSISIALIGVMSLACAAAGSYRWLFVFRGIQGVGIGGEVPVAACYISELAAARRRGRFFLLYEMIFGVGLTTAALVGYWAVPRFGWQSMFLLGAVPAALALPLRRLLPESPRWLAAKGRLAEAERVVRTIEARAARSGSRLPPLDPQPLHAAPAPAPTRWSELFAGPYRRRTLVVWIIWFCCYFVTYGLTTWLPTLYRTVFGLDVATALRFSLATNVAGLAGDLLVAFAIDRVGRRGWFRLAFIAGAVPLAGLWLAGAPSAPAVVLGASASYVFVASNALVCYLYTPEIYPTRLRALGSSIATAWLRIGSAAGPIAVGYTLVRFSLGGVFLLFALVSLAGAVVAGAWAIETRGRVLEEISL